MRRIKLAQWNREWVRPNSACQWQGADETEVSIKLTEFNSRAYEIVRIESNGPDMFGITDNAAAARMEDTF